jgi:hypothetical protein
MDRFVHRGQITDITELKDLEEQLRQSENGGYRQAGGRNRAILTIY